MAYTTKSTVIAAFRSSADAESAARDLEQAGFSAADVRIEGQGSSSTQSRSGNTHHEGGITGWFKSIIGSDDDETSNDQGGYERALNQGNVILTVEASEDRLDAIESILNRYSPVNVHNEGEDEAYSGGSMSGEQLGSNSYSGGSQGYSAGSQSGANTGVQASAGGLNAQTPATGTRDADSQAIPVVQEELQVGKRRVLRGGVRVYTRVVEEQVSRNVDLTEEHVRVDRRPVDRAATEADFAGGREQVVEMTEFAEQPVVSKQARVVEEVRVGKDVTSRSQNVSDTVRHTEVDVENIPAAGATQSGSTFDESDFRRDFQTNYGTGGADYDTYSPAYRYGFEAASDPRYRGKRFEDVESNLRSDYSSRYPNSTWDKFKNAVRTGWDKVTNKV